MRRILRTAVKLLAGMLTCALLAGIGIYREEPAELLPVERDIELNYLFRDIYIDGKLISNYELHHPVYVSGDEFFVPTKWGEKTFSCDFPDAYGSTDPECIMYIDGVKVDYDDVFYVDNYPYMALSRLSKYKKDLSFIYDDITGLYISNDPLRPAKDMVSEENKLYITSLMAYMQKYAYKTELDDETAFIYEFYFRHAAKRYDVDELLLLAICQSESGFNKDLSKDKGPQGLMEIMDSSAARLGYTVEQIRDVHTNIDCGAMYIHNYLVSYKGDMTKTLSAYNQGPGKVKSGEYSTTYAGVVSKRQKSIQRWLKDNSAPMEIISEL